MATVTEILGNLPDGVLDQLHQVDQRWSALRAQGIPVATVVHRSDALLGELDWDVVICGGTLGILLGAALAQRGWRVVLLERGILRGRQQEWNISRPELTVLVELGLLSATELEQAIAVEFNPNRIQFMEGPAVWVRDVLNIGVDPVLLLETLKTRFRATGGQLLEHTAFKGVTVHPDGVAVQTSDACLKARLMLDVMGHGSPVVAQARRGQRPDGICLVVGTCAQGMPAHETGDLLVSRTPIQDHCQYFWEAFPAREGRTTYLFTYADLHPQRPSLAQMFEAYFQQLPDYQGVPLSQLQIQRALFGLFPSYQQSPLALPWDRLVAVGDSSGSQSPLSFGGFGAMLRHLRRLDAGLDEALTCDALSKRDLALLQPYQPNLSSTWLFQQSMRAPMTRSRPDQINRLLAVVFESMAALGDPVLKPFLQDVVQFPGLLRTLVQVSLRHPELTPQILANLGPLPLLQWLPHFWGLGLYSGFHRWSPWVKEWSTHLAPLQQYRWQRRLEAWQYGAGYDHLG